MDKKANIFWGVLLVVVGFLFLANSLDWVNFTWTFREVARFWPVLLILAGVAAFLNEKKSVYNATSALLIAFAIPLAIFSWVSRGVDRIKNEISDEIHIDLDDDDNNNTDDSSDTLKGDRVKQYFMVDKSGDVSEVKLNLKGGAAEFDLTTTDTKLFEADALLDIGRYTMTEDNQDGKKVIDFEMKKRKSDNGHWDFGDNKKNNVNLKLNTAPIWDIDLGFGAGEVDFDLSPFKVKKLDVETGAASIDVKLGDKLENAEVKVKSGAASVKLEVPKSVGCRINIDGALNDKNFIGFVKVDDDTWESEGYANATKKIKIELESGLSELKVTRY